MARSPHVGQEARGGPAQGAAAIYERALAHAPALGDAQIKLAKAYLEMGRDRDARPLLDRALAIPATREEAARLLRPAGAR